MAKHSNIQWTDDTVNPVMGCGGCELWPTLKQIVTALCNLATNHSPAERGQIKAQLHELVHQFRTAVELYHERIMLYKKLREWFPEVPGHLWLETIERLYRCYAGILHLQRGGKPGAWDKPQSPGHARNFERPQRFPSRMADAAAASDLRGEARPDKPWIKGLRRLIFVSDMGDALSEGIDFDFLKTEIVDVVTSPKGRRHLWLWLTKRPHRMAEFSDWLIKNHELEWPDNLVAMTSVTNRATRSRIDDIRKVPAKLRGLSVEPLVESVELNLTNIDWLIVGGESGKYAREFDIEWARSLREQCRRAGTAFFVKQLGANPVEDGFPIDLRDSHGGKWEEWPEDLRVREFPETFAGPNPLSTPS